MTAERFPRAPSRFQERHEAWRPSPARLGLVFLNQRVAGAQQREHPPSIDSEPILVGDSTPAYRMAARGLGYNFAGFFFQRAAAAFLAIADLSAGVRETALERPPLRPPLRPALALADS